ncbi:MAG: S9 family peptidase [Muribaculaceae bacterium]|nr:S9 family peptidase [Muribaculaceae bacterium]
MALNKLFLYSLLLLTGAGIAPASNIDINTITYRGPLNLPSPLLVDSIDIFNKNFNPKSFLDLPANTNILSAVPGDSVMILGDEETAQLHFITIPVKNSRFANIDVSVKGNENYKILLNGKENSPKLTLKPGTYDITVKVLTLPGEKDTISFSLSSPSSDYIYNLPVGEKRAYTLDDVLYTTHFDEVKVSPSGKFALLESTLTAPENYKDRSLKLISMKDGHTIQNLQEGYQWMEDKDVLWNTKTSNSGKVSIITLDPQTLSESVFAENIPEGDFIISPDNSCLFYELKTSGPKEDSQIYRIAHPEDRQDGWRDRYNLAVYDIKTGIYRPLTFGNSNISLMDVSPDGQRLLLMSMRNRLEKRPTTVFSLYDYEFKSGKIDTLVFEDGFVNGALYSPDASKIVIMGSPEALNGIGLNLPEGKIPNMTEGELFLMDLTTKEIEPFTKEFNPSVQSFIWNKADGKIYFSAEDKDLVSLFNYDPKSGMITNLEVPEEIVKKYSLASLGGNGAFIGESSINPDNLYSFEFVKNKPIFSKIGSTGDELLSEVALAEVRDWDFVNSNGDTINGRLYLPPGFDPAKKYPLIVNYYGGCSPTSRNFATRYPHHLYASQGYVVYVLNPSGATGFGQEFASRHVNTAGEGVARDIIEGTTKLAEDNPWINKEKIGCIGASYGGFMTQYLQTVSDIFAAAISHAGISDHTSYWGNGYWGYSYSEVSMAESYPWTNPDLYVKQSPLYNADKVNTPILFLHGDGDTNVPPAESIQMFTALKLLGKDTALVEVTDQNHHILDNEKRQKWQDTIFAWFAKYLQDDPTWWNELYPSIPRENASQF